MDSNGLSREIFIPKWALTAFIAAWSTFVVIFLPWSIWVTHSLYSQSRVMSNIEIRLGFIDQRTVEMAEMRDRVIELNRKIDKLTAQISTLESRPSGPEN